MEEDITERRRDEERLRLAATVFETATEAIMVCDATNRIEAVNHAFEEVTGYQAGEVVGKNPSLLSSGRHDAAFYREMWRSIDQRGAWSGEIWNRRKSGELYAEWLSISVIRDADGAPSRYVSVFSDITQRKQAEEKMLWQATHDALTELPNRILFKDRLETAIARAERDRGGVAVLFVDLDGFKAVNDRLGHDFGDRLLQEAARRMRDCVRGADTLARLAGDEFTLLLVENGDARAGVVRVAPQIVARLADAFEFDGARAQISASIGAAVYPDHGTTVAELLRCADAAMYRVKQQGRNGYEIYTADPV